MKLFDEIWCDEIQATFEAVKFPEENLIFVTRDGYLYYIYHSESKYWRKHRNAGNDHITVAHYPDVGKGELEAAMQGKFPQSEADFLRLCNPSRLRVGDLLYLLKEEYAAYLSEYEINNAIHCFLREADIPHKAFEKLRKCLGEATKNGHDSRQVLAAIKELCFAFIGRDIFKQEIGIVDGHDCSSYFWIMPVRVIDDFDTNGTDNVAEMRSAEISIEEDDVAQYLTPFLYRYFDDELEANKNRIEYLYEDEDGVEQIRRTRGFEWNLTHNFYTFESMDAILNDIRNTIDALSCGAETEYTKELGVKRGSATHTLLYAKDLTQEQIEEYNANRPTEDDTEPELIIDFYRRFLFRMEYMMRVGEEKGYNLISFMGP